MAESNEQVLERLGREREAQFATTTPPPVEAPASGSWFGQFVGTASQFAAGYLSADRQAKVAKAERKAALKQQPSSGGISPTLIIVGVVVLIVALGGVVLLRRK